MCKKNSINNQDVFSDVITSIVIDAADAVEGISVLAPKKSIFKRNSGVTVYFLSNDRVSIDMFVDIGSGYNIPPTVAQVQEKVKEEVEGATKFRVHSVNVQIVSVIFPQ